MKRSFFGRSRGIAILGVLLLAGLGSVASGQAEKPTGGAAPPEAKLISQMPAGATAKAFRFPTAATKTLPNGLRVFVVRSSAQPAVAVRLVLTEAGAAHDPSGKPGVAAMTANLLTQGTGKRTAQQIAEAIDVVGGTLSASADKDGTYVTATVVKKDFDLAMDLLADVALHAAFQKEELERRRQQLLSGLRVQYVDPSYLANVILRRVVYGPHPYGLPSEGTPDSARALEREDLVRFRDIYYAPNQALLAFAGDITPEAAFAAAEKYFGAWPKKEVPAGQAAAPAGALGLRIFLIEKPDAVQTQIRAGRLGIRRSDLDYIPLYVTNRIFGGGFNSRLSTEVRQKKGLTYGAYSNFSALKQGGAFEVSTFTRTEATVEATKLVVGLIGRMAAGEVTKEELDFARDYLVGVFPIESETPSQVAERILNVAQFELPANYNDTYQDRVRGIGAEQVKAMAARHFDAASLDLVLVGNVSQFRDALKKEFPGAKCEEIPFEQVDLLAADLRKPKEAAAPASAPVSAEALERGRAILTAAAEAAGGAAIGKIESLEINAPGEFSGPQGPIRAEVKVVVGFPDRVRIEVKTPFFTFVQGFDGKSGWLASPQGAMDLPPALNAEVQRAIDLEAGLGLFRQVLAGSVKAQSQGEEEVEGKKYLAVQWDAAAGKTKLYFDPTTRLLAGARYRQVTMQGTVETLQLWSDFRLVPSGAGGAANGVQFPFRWVNYRDGAKYSEQTIQDVKPNTKLDPALFAKPAKPPA